jgi:hypothetical protein
MCGAGLAWRGTFADMMKDSEVDICSRGLPIFRPMLTRLRDQA